MAGKNEAKVKFTAETGEFNAGIAKANSTLTKLRSELKLNATEMKGASDDAELLSKRQELLAQEAAASQDKIEALNAKLDKAREIFGENSTEADRLATQLANAKNAEAKIQQEIEKVNAALDEQKAASNKAESALSQLEAEISAQKTELSSLKEEYKNVVLEQDESSDKAQKLASKISSLNSDLNKNEQKLKEAERAADGLGDAFQDSAQDAEQSADGYTMAKDVISDFATQAVQAGIDKLKELGVEGERALNKLQVNTGASSDTMTRYKDVMDAVYAGNYGETYDDVANAMSTVVQVMGDMPDDKLQSVTQNAMTLADKFDMDVNESVRAANSMMDQFGISSQDAYDLIVQGAQNGLNQNGDLLDTINEYGVQFSQAGYSADDMFNMLKNGAEDGTWSIDKLGDAVKEYNIRMTDGTANDALKELGLDAKKVTAEYAKGGDSAKSATEKVITALMGVEDEQERYKLGQQIMGTMWEDLGEDAVKALMDTEGAISSSNDAMKEVDATAYDDIGSKLTTLGRMFETQIIGPVKDAVMPVLGGLVDFFTENFNAVAPIVTGVAVAFGILAAALAIQGLIAGVSKAFAILNGVLALNPIVLIIAAVAGLVAAFLLLWKNCEGFRSFWKGLWDKISSFAKSAINKAKKTISELSEKFREMKEKVSQNWRNLKTQAVNIWNGIKSAISEKIQAARNVVNGAVEKIKGAFNKIKAAKDTVVGVFNSIKSAITDKINAAKNAVSNAIDRIKGLFNFSWSLPKIKLPHFSVSGGKAPWGFGGKGSLPKVSVEWFAKGGIMTQPTLFGAVGSTLLGGGEAGSEAILPISLLQDYIDGAFERNLLSFAGGTTYNLYVNDAQINGDEQIRDKAKELIEDLVQLGGM